MMMISGRSTLTALENAARAVRSGRFVVAHCIVWVFPIQIRLQRARKLRPRCWSVIQPVVPLPARIGSPSAGSPGRPSKNHRSAKKGVAFSRCRWSPRHPHELRSSSSPSQTVMQTSVCEFVPATRTGGPPRATIRQRRSIRTQGNGSVARDPSAP